MQLLQEMNNNLLTENEVILCEQELNKLLHDTIVEPLKNVKASFTQQLITWAKHHAGLGDEMTSGVAQKILNNPKAIAAQLFAETARKASEVRPDPHANRWKKDDAPNRFGYEPDELEADILDAFKV